MPKAWAVFFCLAAASAVSAQELRERLRGGFDQLGAGAVDEAMATFRDVQTDDPESDLVHYSIARAQYEQALLDADSPEDALESLFAARAAFDELTRSANRFVRENASYNSANCSALIAKHSAAEGNHEETVKGFEESIRGYEEVLEKRPDHNGARNNLHHMRYLLKKMLQNPPPPEEQEPQQEGDGEEQENEEQPEGEGEAQEEEPEQEGEESEGQPSEEEGASEPSDQEQEREPQPPQGEEGEEQEPLSRQNIEAILKSLEEQDREEQKNLRRSKTPPRVKGNKWW